MSKNMQRSQTWVLNVLKEWLNGDELDMEVEFVESNWEGKSFWWLCKFIAEAKQRSVELYSPKTLLQLLVNLQSYASDRNPAAFNFMDAKDPIIWVLHNVLNNHSKKLLHDGIGAKKKQARVIKMEEEELCGKKE